MLSLASISKAADTGIAPPTTTLVAFANMASLTLTTGNGNNTLSVLAAPTAGTLTLNPGNGPDQVTLNSLAATTNVNLGNGSEQVLVDAGTANAALTIKDGSGAASIDVQLVGTNATATITGTSGRCRGRSSRSYVRPRRASSASPPNTSARKSQRSSASS